MATAPINTVQQQGISPYASEYTTDLLGRGRALAETSYTPYGGNRLAEFSPLQKQAFEGIGGLTGYKPMDYSDPSKFMSPYQQNVTDIALREARRQSDITGQANAARAVQQGAFGGSRHGLVEAEQQRNLQQQLGDIQAKGLQAAFESAQRGQYLQDLADRYGYSSGVEALKTQLGAGTRQQEQEQKGLDIDYGTFKEQREFPYENLRFQKSLLQGFPITTTSVTGELPKTDWLSTLGGVGGLLAKNPDAIKNILGNLGGSASGISSLFSNLFGSGGGGASLSNTDEALRYLDSSLTGFY